MILGDKHLILIIIQVNNKLLLLGHKHLILCITQVSNKLVILGHKPHIILCTKLLLINCYSWETNKFKFYLNFYYSQDLKHQMLCTDTINTFILSTQGGDNAIMP